MEKKRAVPIRRASFRAIAYEARLRVETMEGRGGGGCCEGCGCRWTNLFPNNFQCSAVQRGWPAGIMYTRGLASLSSRGTVRRAKG